MGYGGGAQSCLEWRLRPGDEDAVAGHGGIEVSGRSAQDGVASGHRAIGHLMGVGRFSVLVGQGFVPGCTKMDTDR